MYVTSTNERIKVNAFDIFKDPDPTDTLYDYKTGSIYQREKVQGLYGNLMLPSYVHGYSLAIEYMSQWFDSKFEKDYLKSIYIDGKHVIDDYKKFSKQVIKGENPRARIEPRVDFDYDRDGLDFYMGPPSMYLKRCPYQESFFKDYDNSLFLAAAPRAMRMNFNFKVRVNTRSQQLDLFNKMDLNFRIGCTQFEYLSVDFHVPKSIILNIAKMSGFEIKNGEVVDIITFLHYLNSHSDIPFLFKLRAINQKPEYFMRVNNLYTHISCKDKLQLDDGERNGKLDFDFHVEMNAILTIPVPYYFAFYTASELTTEITMKEDSTAVPIYSINSLELPIEDEHGWNQGCVTDYLVEKGDTHIDISDLFRGDNVLSRAINHDLTLGVLPSHFINIKIYRDEDLARKVEFDTNWSKMSLRLNNEVKKDEIYHIVVYIDRQYINELDINLAGYNKNRVSVQPDEALEDFKNNTVQKKNSDPPKK